MSSEKRMPRLRDDEASEIEKLLLASAADDEMPEEKYRALVDWGARLGTMPARPTWRLTIGKGLGLLALGALAVGVGGYAASRTEPRPSLTSVEPRTRNADAIPTGAAGANHEPNAHPGSAADPIPVLSLDQLPSAPAARGSSVTPPSTAETRRLGDDDASFAEQMKLIDAARSRLRRDDPRGALAVLDEYERRFTSRAFEEEATVLRVSALAKTGDRARAKRIGEAFLRARPSEIYRRRVETVVRTLDAQERTP